jgi:hypothetical protein
MSSVRLEDPYRFAPVYHWRWISIVRLVIILIVYAYLGEKVVSENEYLSAMLGLLLPRGFCD